MKVTKQTFLTLFLIFSNFFCTSSQAKQKLRLFIWDGYVTPQDLKAVNEIFDKKSLNVEAEIIKPFAEDSNQMFNTIRGKASDLSFLTLNYIKSNKGKQAQLLQLIDTTKLKNYSKINSSLKELDMGSENGKPYYIPFGGGAYGIWANMKKISKEELPKSINDLLDPKWKGKISLTKSQIQPNIALAMLAKNNPPFLVNDLVTQGKREEAIKVAAASSDSQKFLNALYGQVGEFWEAAPKFHDPLVLVASYGVEIAALNAAGGDWQLVNFKEGNTVWLDTMNIMKHVSGKKLEAAYEFMDYFLTPEVQNRVVSGLSMVAVTTDVKNPLLENNPSFFSAKMFWPVYDTIATNLMQQMSDSALKK